MSDSLLHYGKESSLPHSSFLRNKYVSAVTSRMQRSFPAFGDTFAGGNSTINIPISLNSWVDLQRSVLLFDLKMVPTIKLARSANSLFRSIRIRSKSGKQLSKATDVDLLSAVLQTHTLGYEETESSMNILSLTHNIGVDGKGDVKIPVACQLNLSFLKVDYLLPFHLLGELSLELILQTPVRCTIRPTGSNEMPSISNVRMLVECVTMTPEAELQFINEFDNNNMKFHLHSWDSSVFNCDKANKTDRLIVKNEYNSLLGVMVVPRYSNDISDNTKQPYRFCFPKVKSIQFRLGTDLQEEMTSIPEYYWNLQDFLDFSNHPNGELVTRETYSRDTLGGVPTVAEYASFVFGRSFSVSKGDDSVLSGNTSKGDIVIEIQRESTDDNLEYTVFCLFESEMSVSRTGGIEIVY